MAFADTIKKLPFTPRTARGSGFLPPTFRAAVHIFFLLACIADEKVEVSDDEAIAELKEAQDHWNARAATTAISTDISTKTDLIGKAIDEAITEFKRWTAANRIANLRDLGQRIAQNTADLDRELVGIRDSDAGTAI